MKSTVGTLSRAALIAFVVLLVTQLSFAQEHAQIKVNKTEVVTGVVVVDIQKAGKSMELQCNQGQPTCKSLKAGDYWMVELPKNWGMYDCRNAEIYPADKEPGDSPDTASRVGAYCLIEK